MSEWTDELSVRVARGESIESLVDYVVTSRDAGVAWPEQLRVLTRRFALSFDDARLAADRVAGGEARAANPVNEPDRRKDPIAWTAYRRARGEPCAEIARTIPAEVDREAEALWRTAYEGRAPRATRSVDVALRLLDRYAAIGAPRDRDAMGRVLLQVATALSTAAEALIASVSDTRCALPGTQPFTDAIELWNASERLADLFVRAGTPELVRRVRGLRGRIVTGLLGSCHAWVGEIMLEAARGAWQDSVPEAAAGSCDAVILDFVTLLEDCEEDLDRAPFDEQRLGLERLRDALALRAEIALARAESLDPSLPALRARVDAQLAR